MFTEYNMQPINPQDQPYPVLKGKPMQPHCAVFADWQAD